MKLKVTSLHDRPVGLGGSAMLLPGCSAVIEVTDAELKAWKECSYVKVQLSRRPKGSGDETALPDAVDTEYESGGCEVGAAFE